MFSVSQYFIPYYRINSLQMIATLFLSQTLLEIKVFSEANTGKVGKYVYIAYEIPLHREI